MLSDGNHQCRNRIVYVFIGLRIRRVSGSTCTFEWAGASRFTHMSDECIVCCLVRPHVALKRNPYNSVDCHFLSGRFGGRMQLSTMRISWQYSKAMGAV